MPAPSRRPSPSRSGAAELKIVSDIRDVTGRPDGWHERVSTPLLAKTILVGRDASASAAGFVGSEDGTMRRLTVAAALLLLGTIAGSAQETTKLRVNVFPGVQNLALYVGQAKGVFARHKLEVDLQFTANSPAQREGLAKGSFEIAHAGVDNSVALAETGAGSIIVMGGDSSMQELFAQADVSSIADLWGRTVIVDAPNTAYALIVRKVLQREGLQDGRDYTLKPTGGTAARYGLMKANKDYAAGMLNPPFSISATRDGLRSLGGAVKLVGPYQGTGCWVLRGWAEGNAKTLERYLAAYVEALRWALSPANRSESVALLAERLKIAPDIAAATYDVAADAVNGLAPDARFDMDGFRNVLALRAEMLGDWGGKPPAPDKYVELSYYERAIATLGK
jgi:ABC-type nitrate/sulfonate/bicarbonate transport system substrate-binding protein